MKNSLSQIIAALACGFLLSGVSRAESYLSPAHLAMLPDGHSLLVAQDTGRRLDVVDTASRTTERSIPLPDRPRGLAISADGELAYVPLGAGEGQLAIVHLASGKILDSIPVGHGPACPVVAPDGNTLYICNRFDNTIGIVDLRKKKQVRTVPVPREPVSAALTPDGKLLFVANHLPDGPANLDYVASKVSVMDAVAGTWIEDIPLINGAEGLRGICISPDGKYVFATHVVARFLVPPTQIERGWINTNGISMMRVADRKLIYTVLLDDVDRGFANPWAIAFSPDGKTLVVSSAGGNELSVIDLPALQKKVEGAVDRHAYNDLSIMTGVRQRIPLEGTGPRAVLVHQDRAYVAEYFSDSLSELRLQEGEATILNRFPLGPEQPLTLERKGEILFNDSRICFQHWQSCASCHPDVRTDGLNWDLMLDGLGNPKQVKSLLLAHATPPTTALGVREEMPVSVRAGFRYIHFAVRPEEDALAIEAFLKSLEQTPSPRLVNGTLSPAAKRGEEIFKKAECVRCHPPPLYTNQKQIDVGTGTGPDTGKAFDVPTLREVWRTAPYLHDGRAATIRDTITVHNHGGHRGKTDTLNEQEITDLVEFVESL